MHENNGVSFRGGFAFQMTVEGAKFQLMKLWATATLTKNLSFGRKYEGGKPWQKISTLNKIFEKDSILLF